MSSVTIKGLSKHFGGKVPAVAIESLDLQVEEGEFLVLLGPSGCGKTTTLRCIAGLEAANMGAIAFGERTVFDASAGINLPPNKRNIGMVFQSYALWPHMTVRKNIAYPLRARSIARETASQWVQEVAELVQCEPLLDRYPSQLSGGQQQRVALCRGLVARPDLVLFDEPLSNLDAKLRDSVRAEIDELHQRLGFTAVYVTHDQSEALALGDRLAIMRQGRIEQLGRPEDVFVQPATEYVADFIGMSNRFVLQRDVDGWRLGEQRVTGSDDKLDGVAGSFVCRSQPDDLRLVPTDTAAESGSIAVLATVVTAEFGGRHMDIVVDVGGVRLQSRAPTNDPGEWLRALGAGQAVLATIRVSDLRLFDDQGQTIATSPSALEPQAVHR